MLSSARRSEAFQSWNSSYQIAEPVTLGFLFVPMIRPAPIVMAAVIYFLLLWPVVRLLSRLENRALAGRR